MKSEWNIVSLRNLIGFISKGIAPSYAKNETETTIRVLNQKCNRNFQINYLESRLHDVSKKKVPTERYIKQNDILINSTGTGTAGRIAQINSVPCKTTVDGHMIIIRANEKIDQRYLGYALKAHQKEILQLDEGSTGQTELNRERLLEEIRISYPGSFDEQKKIVSLLDILDEKIQLNNKINDNLRSVQKEERRAVRPDRAPSWYWIVQIQKCHDTQLERGHCRGERLCFAEVGRLLYLNTVLVFLFSGVLSVTRRPPRQKPLASWYMNCIFFMSILYLFRTVVYFGEIWILPLLWRWLPKASESMGKITPEQIRSANCIIAKLFEWP